MTWAYEESKVKSGLWMYLLMCRDFFALLLIDQYVPFSQYSGTPLNGDSSTADTHDITDNSASPNSPSVHFSTQPLNSRHPATPYNVHFTVPIASKQHLTTPI